METQLPSQPLLIKVEMWSNWVQKDIDKDETVVHTLNSLATVAAFIAGVQGQIISFTITLPLSHLGRATNFFAFVGLMLDVIGTFSGVVHALVLQRKINENTAILNATTQLKADIKEFYQDEKSRGLAGVRQQQLNDIWISNLMQRVQELEPEMRRRYRGKLSDNSKSIGFILASIAGVANPKVARVGSTVGDPESAKNSPVSPTLMLTTPFELGHTPLFSMGLGVVGLVVSIILFASETTSLAREVWISCIIILFTVIFFSLVPMSYLAVKIKLKKRLERLLQSLTFE